MTTSDWLGLAGKTVLVTGGGNGIGLAIAGAFLGAGAQVIILDRDPATRDVAEKLAEPGESNVRSFLVDVRDRAALQDIRKTLEREQCPLDIIVPNAGISFRLPLLELRPEQVDEMVATNLTGVISTLHSFAPMIMGRSGARVVVNGSVIAVHGMVLRATYAATKAALGGLVRSLAMEWGPMGVNVNAVGPGVIRTSLIEAYIQDHPDRAEAAKKHTALGRIGTAEEVADAVLFLASHAARFVTGQTLYVDGGLSAGSNWW